MTVVTNVRHAAEGDAAAIAAIYAEGIAGRGATFVTRPPEPETVAAWLRRRGPFLVAERDGEVVGWAAVSEYSDVPAYRGVGEFAIYVANRAQGAGVGRELLMRLCEVAATDGRHKIVGKIFPENAGSLALCRACGFEPVGTHRRHGRLDGEWRDVVVVEKLLA
ncbi:MAG TPA: arsinothricin resistance N-acetyltransferase ArsN1 family A [Solirubrobacteraceae bacterium]|nr:arsinothricin resistance N-acetyltransferase ArsN1 family A [Solirubrobacteraceae bacterium]